MNLCDCVIVGDTQTLCAIHERLTQTAVEAFRLGLLEAQMDAAIDAVQMGAVSIGRIVKIEADDIPRLCVMAACRAAERLAEHYARHRAHLSLEEQGRMKAAIYHAAVDLHTALTEGLSTASTLIASLTTQESHE